MRRKPGEVEICATAATATVKYTSEALVRAMGERELVIKFGLDRAPREQYVHACAVSGALDLAIHSRKQT